MKPLSVCTDETGVVCPNPRLAGRVIRVMGGEILLFTAHIEHTNLMQDMCFLTRDGKLPFILGADFNFPPSLWRMAAAFGFGSWEHQRQPHTCRTGKGQKPDIIDYFLVSTFMRPLIQKCEIVKSVLWGPHYGVKLVLNFNFESVVSRQLVGKISKRSRHNTNALQGQNTYHTEEADPALWNEARRNCVFEGKKPRCQDGQEDTQAACYQYASACGFLEEADELGDALETWSDATTQHWVKVGRTCQIPLSGKVANIRMEPVLGETFMPVACVILEGGGNAELRAWKAFGQWVIRKVSPKSVTPEHALYAARKTVIFSQGGDTLSKKVMEDLSSAEHKSVVDESSSMVFSLLKRECVGSSPQVVWERGCTPRAPAGYQRQSRKLHGRPAMCGGTACPRVEKCVGWRRRHRYRQRNKKSTCFARKTCRRSSCVIYELSMFARLVSLFPVQNGDRSRPARIHRHRIHS